MERLLLHSNVLPFHPRLRCSDSTPLFSVTRGQTGTLSPWRLFTSYQPHPALLSLLWPTLLLVSKLVADWPVAWLSDINQDQTSQSNRSTHGASVRPQLTKPQHNVIKCVWRLLQCCHQLTGWLSGCFKLFLFLSLRGPGGTENKYRVPMESN